MYLLIPDQRLVGPFTDSSEAVRHAKFLGLPRDSFGIRDQDYLEQLGHRFPSMFDPRFDFFDAFDNLADRDW